MLSLSVSDKKALKMMAAEREATIASIIHEWIQERIRKGYERGDKTWKIVLLFVHRD